MCKNMNLEPYLTLYTKLNSKYTMMDLSIKAKKLLEENTGEKLQYLGLGKVLLKSQNIYIYKKKINCTSLKVKTLVSKDTINCMKRQAINSKKYL